MNVGQILETHLGWAARGLGHQIGEVVDKIRGNGATDGVVTDLKAKLKQVYGTDQYGEDVDDLDESELIEMAGNLRNGVPMVTPVVDGAREDEIVSMLEKIRSASCRGKSGAVGEASGGG